MSLVPSFVTFLFCKECGRRWESDRAPSWHSLPHDPRASVWERRNTAVRCPGRPVQITFVREDVVREAVKKAAEDIGKDLV